ncbi:recombinase family protein [Nucisporomicrobium flavum]|uniref:recombinase family protein n=1 Tax=Nucisporomicrobium flavum TaxID=2785915 RepID=UPI003C2C122C
MTEQPLEVSPPTDDVSEVGLLGWLRLVAGQHGPDTFGQAVVPVAWMGRTSTDDAQDPTLSLPRQLANARRALPPGFVIVAKFYDVESGRTTVEHRGIGNAHERFDIPIPRDGGIADLLAEAQGPNRRFVAVVCESIERVARTTYISIKIEHDLEQAGVALLAADEGIDPSAVQGLDDSAAPLRRATPTLTRRIKQAISEWYVLNMLELSWDGTKAHTYQGFNIGRPPYGYLALKTRHPVKNKAEQGMTKHRLVPDPVRGPVVTQIFLLRALERIGYQAIADRLNRESDRYPPPDPILGEGRRRRVGAWTASNVREVLDNPKHTGYMVWNRRRRPRPERGIRGKVNPPTAWVWSARPTHEPLVTRDIFEAASTVARFRQGSRSEPTRSPSAHRTYLLRSYLRHTLCDRRMWGHSVRHYTYYRCSPNPRHDAHHPWFDTHPPHVTIREDRIIPVLDQFFEQRIFGKQRADLLAPSGGSPGSNDDVTALAATLADDIAALQRRQYNLLAELEQFEPSGDHDFDQAWRSGVQARFRTMVVALKAKNALRAELSRRRQKPAKTNPVLLEVVPKATVAVSRLPQKQRRRLFDAFHLELRYNHLTSELDIQVTITSSTANPLGATVQAIIAGSTDEELAADPPNARSWPYLSPEAPTGPRHDQLIIEERIVLRPGR